MKLNAKAFGLTFGIFAGGLWVMLFALSLINGVFLKTLLTLGGLHPGFSYSLIGLVQISIMHFIGGFVLGWLFAKLYNRLSK